MPDKTSILIERSFMKPSVPKSLIVEEMEIEDLEGSFLEKKSKK